MDTKIKTKILLICGVPPVRGIANFESAISAPLLTTIAAQNPYYDVRVLCPEPDVQAATALEGLVGKTISGIHYAKNEKRGCKLTLDTLLHALRNFWPPSASKAYVIWGRSMVDSYERLRKTWEPDLLHFLSPTAATIGLQIKGKNSIYSAIDSLSLALENGALGRKSSLAGILRSRLIKRLEGDLIKGKKVLIYVSDRDAERSRRQFTVPTLAIPIGCDLERFQVRATYRSGDRRLVFVGSPAYAPNKEALNCLLEDIWPAIKARLPDFRLELVGRGMTKYLQGFSDDMRRDVHYQEFVQDLQKVLSEALVAVYPLQSGSGMKNKVLDALSVGLPVVAFPEALSGHNELPGVHVSESSDKLVDAVVRLAEDKSFWEVESKRATEAARERCWTVISQRYYDIWKSAAYRKTESCESAGAGHFS